MSDSIIKNVSFKNGYIFPEQLEMELSAAPINNSEISLLIKEIVNLIKQKEGWEGEYHTNKDKKIRDWLGLGVVKVGKKNLIIPQSKIKGGIAVCSLMLENKWKQYGFDSYEPDWLNYKGQYHEKAEALYFLKLAGKNIPFIKIDEQSKYKGLVNFNIVSIRSKSIIYEAIELGGLSSHSENIREVRFKKIFHTISDTNQYYNAKITRKISYNIASGKKRLLGCSVEEARALKTS